MGNWGDPITSRDEARLLPKILAVGSNGCVQACLVKGGVVAVKRSYCLKMPEDIKPIYSDANGIMREVAVLAGLKKEASDHPGYSYLVPFVGACVSETGEPLILLEMADQSLENKLAAGPVSHGEFLQLSWEIFSGLECLSTLNLVHQDVKPGNILLKGGKVWLADFGETTSDQGIASLGVLGEPWTAEERIGGTKDIKPFHGYYELPQPATDVWSTGLTMIAMLSKDSHKAGEFLQKLHEFSYGTTPADQLDDDQIEQLRSQTEVVVDEFLEENLTGAMARYTQPYAELLYRIFDPDPRTRITSSEARQTLGLYLKKIT
ncbi:protein kinase [Parendozoicomonas sp. Alg238-R29]|uniref:protein kinase domain-containing protein n=1 Tax=Parendozoicomonas sp. Alg238-R29 TaxID=2993446 RepID=UPI00248E7979|nr:protein kinase [Parendozoicomonas sp. Alg238-R29]